MKLLSFRHGGKAKYGPKVKREEAVWDVLAIAEATGAAGFPQALAEGIERHMDFVEQLRQLIESVSQSPDAGQYKRPFDAIEWLAPLPRTPKNIMAIGRNYRDHAAEMGGQAEALTVFTKSPTSIAADEQELPIHAGVTDQLDYEGELAVVIGKRGKDVPRQQAYDYIFGYTIANDVTARDLQVKHGQYFLGKSLDGSCPMGPYLVTKDEVPDPQALSIATKVNDEIRQDGTTADMLYPVDQIIAELSKLVALEPGDVILTGTPAGVGKGMNPPQFLKAGDTVKISIEGIGTLVNRFR